MASTSSRCVAASRTSVCRRAAWAGYGARRCISAAASSSASGSPAVRKIVLLRHADSEDAAEGVRDHDRWARVPCCWGAGVGMVAVSSSSMRWALPRVQNCAWASAHALILACWDLSSAWMALGCCVHRWPSMKRGVPLNHASYTTLLPPQAHLCTGQEAGTQHSIQAVRCGIGVMI